MRRAHLAAIAALGLATSLAACGGNDSTATGASASSDATTVATTTAATTTSTTTTATTPAPTSTSGRSLTITMDDYSFDPKNVVAKAGRVTISAPNVGSREHEMVLLRTNADPAHLPKKNGEVSEAKSVGEIADVEAGKTKKHTFNLKPGRYVLLCNLSGHYASGMYGSLTVK